MRASRGMGCINPAKMPKGTVKQRRDNTDFTEYAEGGEANPKFKIGKAVLDEPKRNILKDAISGADKGIRAAKSAMSPLGLPLDIAYSVVKKATGKSPAEDLQRRLQEIEEAAANVGKIPPGDEVKMSKGGKAKSKVNAAGNYTKPGMRKALFESIKGQATQGTAAGQWSARKAQLLAKRYKEKGGGYRD